MKTSLRFFSLFGELWDNP